MTSGLLDPETGINVRRLLQTAVALAEDNDGRVLLLGLATADDESSLKAVREQIEAGKLNTSDSSPGVKFVEERQSQLTRIVDIAQDLGQDVSVTATVRVVTDPTNGILDILKSRREMAVLLLRGTSLDEGGFLSRSTIDAVLAEADCDVFVENLGTQSGSNALYIPDIDGNTVASLAESEADTIDSVLLPVGTGPHSALATEAARAVASAADAPVTVLHVIDPDASGKSRADAKDLLKFAEYVLGPAVTVETEIQEAADPTEVIVETAQMHDFTAIGAPEQQSRLEHLVFESVQETLTERSRVRVLIARDSDRTMRSLYYHWKQGIDAMDSNESQ
ncbi:universal stress protein [Halorhabdus rudnickae]|uniref:universal stress protein n=1 Tax=Halorhabdus rudnickae TaxID=1775544 RepID=UPI001FCE5B92|nr:universal stress protein [Halorhabdus rudnickae]